MFLHLEAHAIPIVRERSRSYSPYLSPHEVEAQNRAAGHTAMDTSGASFTRDTILTCLRLFHTL